MIDQREGIQAKNTRESVLTPEQGDRADADIATFSLIRDFATASGYTFALSAGYAVEAHRGGKITRPHSDMDGILFLPDIVFRMDVEEDIFDRLQAESSRWERSEVHDDYFEYREAMDGIAIDDRRKLEIDLWTDEDSYETSKKILVDSKGKEHEFEVLGIPDLVAGKIRILNRLGRMTSDERQKERFRELAGHDRDDFYFLVNHPTFNKEAVIENLIKHSSDPMSDQEAGLKAEEEWSNAFRILEGQGIVR